MRFTGALAVLISLPDVFCHHVSVVHASADRGKYNLLFLLLLLLLTDETRTLDRSTRTAA